MTDEIFRLTPRDVRAKELPVAMRGYDRQRVEEFRAEVADELERLTRLNQELSDRAKSFQEQLRTFRERDKALNDALISAQQLRAEVREQADREAQLILREARSEAERLVETQRSELHRLADEIAALERVRRVYLAQLRTMCERQLAEIEAAEASPAPGSSGDESGRAGKATPAWLDTLIKE
ncbi:MAG TPA: DivIVA domain-containing protein [Gemmatimonadaceae bacterium]|nr:DivIVA domain-containing protein [Gemmatimonadaceae bacterium]